MKLVLVVVLLLLSLTSAKSIECLLEDNVTDKCLKEVSRQPLQSEIADYLCEIALQRSLLEQAETFCRAGYDGVTEYRYFKVLLLRSKFEEAFKVEYNRFFGNPFKHTAILSQVLSEVDPALPNSEEAIESLPTFSRSIFYFYTNQTQKSLTLLQQHLKLNKNNNKMIYQHFLMTRIQLKLQQHYDALQYINEVLNKNSVTHPYFHQIKGNFLMHHVKFNEAIVEFKKAIYLANTEDGELHFKSFQKAKSLCHYNIGLCYEKLGSIEEAIKNYEKSYVSFKSVQALNALGHASYSLFKKTDILKHLDLAEKYYKQALKENDKYTILIFNLGILKIAQKDVEGAIHYFQQCLAMESSFQSCNYGLLKSYYLNNNFELAKELVDSIEKTEQTLIDLVSILYELEYFDKALELFGEKDDYRSAELMTLKGYNEYALDRYQKAETSFNRAISLGGKTSYVYDALGQTQLLLRKYQDCARSLAAAYKIEARKETLQLLEECKKHLDSDL